MGEHLTKRHFAATWKIRQELRELVVIDTAAGRGTTFTVLLPLRR